MRIAILNIYGGTVSRGAEVAIHEIAKRLNRLYEVCVFQSNKVLNSEYAINSNFHFPVISTDVSNNILFRVLKKLYLDPYSLQVLLFSLFCIPTLLKNKYDILIPVNGFWQIIICKIISLFQKNKIAVLGYAGIGSDDYINLKLMPDIFFAMTHVASRWAKKINRSIPIKILPGGVDVSLFNPSILPMKLPLNPPIVLSVAALQPYKRIDLVIKAVAKLPEASLVIAGNGILKNEIENLGNKLLPGRFLRLDVDHKNLPSLYTACNVFTLPSMHSKSSFFYKYTGIKPQEAFGIVYLEALSCGLTVVAPNDELRKEIIGPSGIFVDCTNIEKYTSAIKKALSTKHKTVLLHNHLDKFNWDKIVNNFSRDLELMIKSS